MNSKQREDFDYWAKMLLVEFPRYQEEVRAQKEAQREARRAEERASWLRLEGRVVRMYEMQLEKNSCGDDMLSTSIGALFSKAIVSGPRYQLSATVDYGGLGFLHCLGKRIDVQAQIASRRLTAEGYVKSVSHELEHCGPLRTRIELLLSHVVVS